MTNQEIFDTIISHLRTQKYSCMDDGFCRYYDPKTGRKCAVGCLIPLEMYDSEMDKMEGDTEILTNDLVKDTLERLGIDLKLSLGLLMAMQTVHDLMVDDTWGEHQEQQCLDVAVKYSLVYNPV